MQQPEKFKFQPETKEGIDYLIWRIKPDVATGGDQISPRLLKVAVPVILSNLKDVINLWDPHFPRSSEESKCEDTAQDGDYNSRPISILTTISN